MRLWGHGGRGARRWVDGEERGEGQRERGRERGEKGQNKDERIEGREVEEGKREKRNKD